ncbi:MAG TPA: HDOD domain-containing protein, partial [bacterium]|nr:HDOD domain-containing protein [bacterium]
MSSDELIKRILKEVGKMPPLPDVLTKVMQMTKDPDVSASQMNKVISMDQALTANILKLCNSAYYGLPRVISSVTQAVMYLGFQTVRNLVMTCTMQDVYAGQMQGYGYPEGGLWKHSVSVAIASQILCKKIRPGLNDTAFTAGLLHDLGKTILNKHVGGRFQEVAAVMQQKNAMMHEAEAEVFGFDHAIIGAKIADQWNF